MNHILKIIIGVLIAGWTTYSLWENDLKHTSFTVRFCVFTGVFSSTLGAMDLFGL